MSILFLRVLRPHGNKDEYLVTIRPNLDSDTDRSKIPPLLNRSEVCTRLINNCNHEELHRLENFLCGKARQITTTVSEVTANRIDPNWRL